MVREFYHTQEHRRMRLQGPIICDRDDAWLGTAYYFWDDIEDAEVWGNQSKNRTGWYEIYKATIDCRNVLDTVFDEEGYRLWLGIVTDFAKDTIKRTHTKPTLKELNDYLKERVDWKEVDGILFQDFPNSIGLSLIQPIKVVNNRPKLFAYRKRIQLALYNIHSITNFALHSTKRCV